MRISSEVLGPNVRVRRNATFKLLERELIVKEIYLISDFYCGNCEYEEQGAEFSILGHDIGVRNGLPVVETTAEYECPQCNALTELVGQEDQATFNCVFTVEQKI